MIGAVCGLFLSGIILRLAGFLPELFLTGPSTNRIQTKTKGHRGHHSKCSTLNEEPMNNEIKDETKESSKTLHAIRDTGRLSSIQNPRKIPS